MANKVTDMPNRPVHPNCRCTIIPIPKIAQQADYRRRGVNLTGRRASADGSVEGGMDFEGWLQRMDERDPDFARKWLGPTRYKYWKSGVSLSDMAGNANPSSIMRLDQLRGKHPGVEGLSARDLDLENAMREAPDYSTRLGQQMDDATEDLQRESNRLQERLDDLEAKKRKWQSKWMNADKRAAGETKEEAKEKLQAARKKWLKVDERAREVEAEKLRTCRRMLQADDPADIQRAHRFVDDTEDYVKDRAHWTGDWVDNLVDKRAKTGDWEDVTWQVYDKDRSQYWMQNIYIGKDRDMSISSYAHEYGHYLADNEAHFRKRMKEYLYMRWDESDPVQLASRVLTGYRDDEYYLPGDPSWDDLYTAKVYIHPSGARPRKPSDIINTEIISQGIERLYNQPRRFADSDPHMFNFIMALLRGDI